MKHILTLFVSNLLFVTCFAFADSTDFQRAQTMAERYIIDNHLSKLDKYNLIVDKHEVIHIFLYSDGTPLITGFPTTASERHKFQIHLYVKRSDASYYNVEYVGNFTPLLNITGTNPIAGGAAGNKVFQPVHIPFAIGGPYTGNLTINLRKTNESNSDYTVISSATLKIAKTIHASIGVGPIYTSLKDPSNIKTFSLPNGSTTLIADDISGRAILAITATFFPWGRNDLLIPSWSLKDRIGVVVGTSLADGNSKFANALIGLQYDFAIGGSLTLGLHCGRVQRVSGIKIQEFKFGTEEFSGNLDSQKYSSWSSGFFIGIQVDSRIFAQLFK